MKIQNSTALVTGANRGIGRAFVEELLKRGVRRVYAAARNTADLAAVIALDPQRVVALKLDVTNPGEVEAAATKAADVNLLINNAGALNSGSVLEVPMEDIRRDMEVNYFGLLAVTRAFVPVLEKNPSAVVNLLSVVSLVNMPGIGGYSASKAAAWSLNQALRVDLGKKKIEVFGVFPGPIDTDMAKSVPMAKTPASVVAEEVFTGIEAGTEDIFPDPMSKQTSAAWKADYKAVERQFAS